MGHLKVVTKLAELGLNLSDTDRVSAVSSTPVWLYDVSIVDTYITASLLLRMVARL